MSNPWEDAVEVESRWFKFEKVGDKIKGTLLSTRLQPGDGNFASQVVYRLKTEDGEWNVGVSTKKQGTVERLNSCKMGEVIGIAFDSESEPSQKGFNKTKNLKVYTFGMDPEYKETIVPEAESEDGAPFEG